MSPPKVVFLRRLPPPFPVLLSLFCPRTEYLVNALAAQPTGRPAIRIIALSLFSFFMCSGEGEEGSKSEIAKVLFQSVTYPPLPPGPPPSFLFFYLPSTISESESGFDDVRVRYFSTPLAIFFLLHRRRYSSPLLSRLPFCVRL